TGQAADGRAEEPVPRVLGSRGGDQHEWCFALPEGVRIAPATRVLTAPPRGPWRGGGELDVRRRRLPHQRTHHVDVGGPGAGILELGKRGDQRQFAAYAPVNMIERGQTEVSPGAVELFTPELEAMADCPVRLAPKGPAGRGARQPCA